MCTRMPSESSSMGDADKHPSAEYPMNRDIPRAGRRLRTAAGWHAIYETNLYALKHGSRRSVKSLTLVNQKGGFSCPSCAWPEPDGERSAAEFCENGAKAIAWEATNRTIGAEFFASYSIEELATRTEQWLGDQGRLAQPMVLRRG